MMIVQRPGQFRGRGVDGAQEGGLGQIAMAGRQDRLVPGLQVDDEGVELGHGGNILVTSHGTYGTIHDVKNV